MNRRHLEYISGRKGVLMRPGAAHGLFGFIQGQPAGAVRDITEHGRYIEEKTKAKTHVYRIILSLSEADALRTGYDNFEAWEELVRNQMPLIAARIGIKAQDLEWGAGVHMKKGNPHCHIMFWDKNQKIKSPFVHWQVSNSLRVDITKAIFAEELTALYHLKNEARAATLNAADDFFTGFLAPFADITDDELAAAAQELKTSPELADGGIIYNRFSNKELTELAQAMFELKDKLPKTGRLNMKLLPPELKKEVKDFALKLLALNVDCRREFERYTQAAAEISAFSAAEKSIPGAKERAGEDMLYRLCNKILSEMKTLNKLVWEAKAHLREVEWRKQLVISLLTEVFGFLSRYDHAEGNRLRQLQQGGELSKQARKDYALQQLNASDYDWEH